MTGTAPERPLPVAAVNFPDNIPTTDWLMRPVNRSQKYTKRQCQLIDSRLEMVKMCFEAGFSTRQISDRARISEETVIALLKKEWEKVTHKPCDFSQALKQTGARYLALASTKTEDASFKDLVNAGSLHVQRANEIDLVHNMSGSGLGNGLGSSSPDQITIENQSQQGPTLAQITKLLGQ